MGFNNKYCHTCQEHVANYFTVCPTCQSFLSDNPRTASYQQYQNPDYTKRPLGVVIIIVLLCIGTLLDLVILASEPDLLLIGIYIFRLVAIVGLVMMTKWGYWLTVALYSFQLLIAFADVTIFMENNIRMIAEANFVSWSDPRVRSIIQSSLIASFLGAAFTSLIILYYLSRKRKYFR